MNVIRVNLGRSWVAATLATFLLLSFVALIVASPWLTKTIVDRSDDWSDVSDIDPSLLTGLLGVPIETAKQWVIRNLWVAHWAMLWETDALSELHLRHEFDDFFRDGTSRAWWEAVGLSRWERESDETFMRTAAAAYRQARAGAGVADDDTGETPTR